MIVTSVPPLIPVLSHDTRIYERISKRGITLEPFGQDSQK